MLRYDSPMFLSFVLMFLGKLLDMCAGAVKLLFAFCRVCLEYRDCRFQFSD